MSQETHDFCTNCTYYLGPYNFSPCPNCGQPPTTQQLEEVKRMNTFKDNDDSHNPYDFQYQVVSDSEYDECGKKVFLTAAVAFIAVILFLILKHG